MTDEQREAIRRKLAADEFDARFLKSQEAKANNYGQSLIVGFPSEGLFKLVDEYTFDDKVLYMDILDTVKYLQLMRQTLETDEEWYVILDNQVKRGMISAEHAEALKESPRIKMTKQEWLAKSGHLYPTTRAALKARKGGNV